MSSAAYEWSMCTRSRQNKHARAHAQRPAPGRKQWVGHHTSMMRCTDRTYSGKECRYACHRDRSPRRISCVMAALRAISDSSSGSSPNRSSLRKSLYLAENVESCFSVLGGSKSTRQCKQPTMRFSQAGNLMIAFSQAHTFRLFWGHFSPTGTLISVLWLKAAVLTRP